MDDKSLRDGYSHTDIVINYDGNQFRVRFSGTRYELSYELYMSGFCIIKGSIKNGDASQASARKVLQIAREKGLI